MDSTSQLGSVKVKATSLAQASIHYLIFFFFFFFFFFTLFFCDLGKSSVKDNNDEVNDVDNNKDHDDFLLWLLFCSRLI